MWGGRLHSMIETKQKQQKTCGCCNTAAVIAVSIMDGLQIDQSGVAKPAADNAQC
jgi:hypothetical protein